MDSGPLRLLLAANVRRRFRPLVDLELVRRVVERALVLDGLTGEVEVSLLLTDDAAVRKLNARYRGIDATTDVLSFALAEDDAAPSVASFVCPPGGVRQLGDIVVSVPRAQAQAAEYDHSFERELAYLTVHGLFHLLGYDHEDEAERRVMRDKEEAALHQEGGQ